MSCHRTSRRPDHFPQVITGPFPHRPLLWDSATQTIKLIACRTTALLAIIDCFSHDNITAARAEVVTQQHKTTDDKSQRTGQTPGGGRVESIHAHSTVHGSLMLMGCRHSG